MSKSYLSIQTDCLFHFRVQGTAGKGYTTVLLTIGANGRCLPPYIIFKSSRLYAHWCPRNVIKGAVFNGTKSGWSDEHCFHDYLEKLFIPNTRHLSRPLLLIFDGHYSHLTIKVVRLAIQNEIHLLCLPSHSTHLLQPLDIYTLKYVKQQWKQILWERNKTTSKQMDKREFVHSFGKLYDFALIPTHCSTAFGKAGIYPYDPRAIKNDRIVKTTLSATTPSSPEQLPLTSSPQQLRQTSSNQSSSSSSPNIHVPIQNKRSPRSNSTPNSTSGEFLTDFICNYFGLIRIDHTISTENSSPQSDCTQPHINSSDDPTTVAYGLLNDVLNETRSFGLPPSTRQQTSPTTTTVCPLNHIHLSTSNVSPNSTLSPDISTDTSN